MVDRSRRQPTGSSFKATTTRVEGGATPLLDFTRLFMPSLALDYQYPWFGRGRFVGWLGFVPLTLRPENGFSVQRATE